MTVFNILVGILILLIGIVIGGSLVAAHIMDLVGHIVAATIKLLEETDKHNER